MNKEFPPLMDHIKKSYAEKNPGYELSVGLLEYCMCPLITVLSSLPSIGTQLMRSDSGYAKQEISLPALAGRSCTPSPYINRCPSIFSKLHPLLFPLPRLSVDSVFSSKFKLATNVKSIVDHSRRRLLWRPPRSFTNLPHSSPLPRPPAYLSLFTTCCRSSYLSLPDFLYQFSNFHRKHTL